MQGFVCWLTALRAVAVIASIKQHVLFADQDVGDFCRVTRLPCRLKRNGYVYTGMWSSCMLDILQCRHRRQPWFLLNRFFSGMQKTAVEFDQAINYVNKIKVCCSASLSLVQNQPQFQIRFTSCE